MSKDESWWEFSLNTNTGWIYKDYKNIKAIIAGSKNYCAEKTKTYSVKGFFIVCLKYILILHFCFSRLNRHILSEEIGAHAYL